MLFLKRSVMYEDESLRGFLTKFATLNKCTQPIDIQKKVEVNKGHHINNLFMIKNKLSLKMLSEKTGTKESALLKGTFNLEISNYTACEKDINYLNMKGFNSLYTKVCPICLDELNYFRKIWDVSIVTTCPIHGCLLLDRCLNCNEMESTSSQKIILKQENIQRLKSATNAEG
ncbi:TniQ family protein [Paenibacillus alginolyticus]|uniref:TniQ family protein n=1 Tax=Paenibacillus alginolyticus TaxID=59839 RepID=A0ABT4GNA6_9BACL|nr:TniQ family protein [Paenibacillus alginolyticus]MCY9697708.1 TniQ family protein [Paenibacillus alginolyticus]MEC0146732.1 TniQ family protein [Paenibacillus alginolyticus]